MGQAYQMGAPGRFFGHPNMAGAYYLLLGPPGGPFWAPYGPHAVLNYTLYMYSASVLYMCQFPAQMGGECTQKCESRAGVNRAGLMHGGYNGFLWVDFQGNGIV